MKFGLHRASLASTPVNARLEHTPRPLAPLNIGLGPASLSDASRQRVESAVHATSRLASSEAPSTSSGSMPAHVREHLERVKRPGIKRTLERYLKRVQVINALEPLMKSKTDAELKALTAEFKERLASGRDTLDSLLPEAFAAVREAAQRTLGLRHYDVQLVGGMVLQDGLIAEMMTGEGKTLMATLPAYLNALEGKGVHVVTVNEYLARRDCELMGRVYSFLGMDALYAPNDDEEDEGAKGKMARGVDRLVLKRRAYAADITYVTSTEICFDYLRSNTCFYPEEIRIMRPFNFCIVDEADFVLIDSALQPMIISEPGDLDATDGLKPCTEVAARMISVERIGRCLDLITNEYALASIYMRDERRYNKDVSEARQDLAAVGIDADAIVSGEAYLDPSQYDQFAHYTLDKKNKQVTLTDAGARFAELSLNVEDLWAPSHNYARVLEATLKAKEHYLRDRDYIVRNNEVLIIDPGTGRAQINTRWRELLHCAVEVKEGLVPKPDNETSSQVTYQAFFRLYKKLSGMSGTAQTEQEELFETYGLSVVPVPTNKPNRRIDHEPEAYKDDRFHLQELVRTIDDCHRAGRPVLVGTGSVQESERLASFLTVEGIPHEVLNARPQYEEQEAGIIAQAGSPGAVTISTNMAGRGTDIVLGGDPSGLVFEHLRVFLSMNLERIGEANIKYYTTFMKRLRDRVTPPSMNSVLQSDGDDDVPFNPYCNWDFLYPLLLSPLDSASPMTPERVTALGYLQNTMRVMRTEESSYGPKDISKMITKAMEIKELIKIRARSLLAAGRLSPPASGSSEYILLPNYAKDWEPIFGHSPGLDSADSPAPGEAAEAARRQEDADGISAALQQFPRGVQALGKAAYILEGLLHDICAKRAESVRQLGGLLVISGCMQSARRLENQLRGRAGRQGDPGETRVMVSLEDPLLMLYGAAELRNLLESSLFSLAFHPHTGELYNSVFDFEKHMLRPVQKYIETSNYGSRSDTRSYGDVLGPYAAYMNEWRRRLVASPERDQRRMLHSLLQFKADELVATHLGPRASSTHPSKWQPEQLIALQSEVLKLMAPHLEGYGAYAVQVPEPGDPPGTQAKIFFYSSPELADRANLAQLVEDLCAGRPIQPIQPTGAASASLELQSLLQERWAAVMGACKGAKWAPPGGLPPAPVFSEASVRTAMTAAYDNTGVGPDADPWRVETRRVEGRYASLYEMFRLFVGDLLVASYEERLAYAARESNYISRESLRDQSVGKTLKRMSDAWRRFLAELERLRSTVMYRAYASLTPLEEYRIESAVLFVQMVETIRRRSAEDMLVFDFAFVQPSAAPTAARDGESPSTLDSAPGPAPAPAPAPATASEDDADEERRRKAAAALLSFGLGGEVADPDASAASGASGPEDGPSLDFMNSKDELAEGKWTAAQMVSSSSDSEYETSQSFDDRDFLDGKRNSRVVT